jgi:hypothetical protein
MKKRRELKPQAVTAGLPEKAEKKTAHAVAVPKSEKRDKGHVN